MFLNKKKKQKKKNKTSVSNFFSPILKFNSREPDQISINEYYIDISYHIAVKDDGMQWLFINID